MVTIFLRCEDKSQFETIEKFIIEFVKCCSHETAFFDLQNYSTKCDKKNYYHTFILSNGNCLFNDKLEALKKCIEKMDYKIQINYFKD